MVRTRVGYAGGVTESPTYHDLADHTESIEIDFDPTRISYAQLLDVFFAEHRPTYPSYSRQYRSAVFVQDAGQRAAVEAKIRGLEVQWGAEIHTAVEPAAPFWRAEDYHQKYSLRRHGKVLEKVVAATGEGWVDSTLAARLNAFAGGYGRREDVITELRSLGLEESEVESFEGVLATCGR